MCYGFLGLRHHSIIGCHDQDDNVSTLGAARPHGSKRGMTGSIQESNLLSLKFHLVGSNVLGDAPGFTSSNIRIANCIQQGCFSMIHMSKDGNNRSAQRQVILILACDHPPP